MASEGLGQLKEILKTSKQKAASDCFPQPHRDGTESESGIKPRRPAPAPSPPQVRSNMPPKLAGKIEGRSSPDLHPTFPQPRLSTLRLSPYPPAKIGFRVWVFPSTFLSKSITTRSAGPWPGQQPGLGTHPEDEGVDDEEGFETGYHRERWEGNTFPKSPWLQKLLQWLASCPTPLDSYGLLHGSADSESPAPAAMKNLIVLTADKCSMSDASEKMK
ncbi:hypothetical protein LEMLEM_LOCUS18319 [Lemmus lemmus]